MATQKTISRGAMFSVSVEVDEDRLKQLRKTPEVIQAACQAGANYWHEKVLPAHFKKDAHEKYGYAQRSIAYLKNRGKGSKPDLIFSGGLSRDLKARASFKATKTSIQIRMSARVLNLVPTIAENNPETYVKHKTGRGYPNLKKEVKAILDDEREAIASVVTAELEKAYAPSDDKKETV